MTGTEKSDGKLWMAVNPCTGKTIEYDFYDYLAQSTNETLLVEEVLIDDRKTPWVWSFRWSWSNVLSVVFSFIGIVGNVLVLLALMKRNSSRHAPDTFIGALALADLLTSIFVMPIPTAISVPDSALGNFYCSIVFTFYPMWTCIHASIYTLTGMSIERFLAVVYPLRLHRRLNRGHVFVYLIAVWILCIPSSFQFFYVRVTNNVCRDTKPLDTKKIIVVYLFLFRFGIPALTMTITQGLTAISLHRQSREMRGTRFEKGGTTPSFHNTAQLGEI
ncbi:galanin receptor 2a-like [Diadema antillarum]|uniref:galanin receptor 2a-like n=1 Tax=Diadema antillarum TaxID=105358 RepID=UPI003A876196